MNIFTALLIALLGQWPQSNWPICYLSYGTVSIQIPPGWLIKKHSTWESSDSYRFYAPSSHGKLLIFVGNHFQLDDILGGGGRKLICIGGLHGVAASDGIETSYFFFLPPAALDNELAIRYSGFDKEMKATIDRILSALRVRGISSKC